MKLTQDYLDSLKPRFEAMGFDVVSSKIGEEGTAGVLLKHKQNRAEVLAVLHEGTKDYAILDKGVGVETIVHCMDGWREVPAFTVLDLGVKL